MFKFKKSNNYLEKIRKNISNVSEKYTYQIRCKKRYYN